MENFLIEYFTRKYEEAILKVLRYFSSTLPISEHPVVKIETADMLVISFNNL